jgi:predicted esterase
MDRACARRERARAKVCAWLAFTAILLFAPLAHAFIELPGSASELGAVVYPATLPGPHPVTVVLHGMCGEPLRTCAHFAEQVTKREHLICPRASQRCNGAGASWPSQGFAEPLERAVTRAEARLGALVDSATGRTLIGYSLGAYRAAELLQQDGNKYSRAVLIGARLAMQPRRLRASGVTRLVLAAGAWDMTFTPLQREAARLGRAGTPVRFLSLGPAGHALAPTFGRYLEEALDWLEDGELVS